MKPLITALGICALLLAPTGAYGVAYTWDGATSSAWEAFPVNNWEAAGYPGKNQADDTATIAISTSACPVTLNSALAWSIATLLIDADAATSGIGLSIQNLGSLTTTGLVTVKGRQDAPGHATLDVDAGRTFSPHSMKLEGAPLTANGDAILIFDEDVTVTDSTGVEVTGFAQVRVGADDTFDAYNLDVGDGFLRSELDMNTNAGLMIADSLTITAGNAATEEATFKLSVGTLQFTDMTLDGYDATAKAVLDLDQTINQSSSDVTVKRVAEMQLASTFTIDDLFIGDNDDAGDDYNGVLTISDGGTVSADSIVIDGESGSGSSLTVSSSTVQTRS